MRCATVNPIHKNEKCIKKKQSTRQQERATVLGTVADRGLISENPYHFILDSYWLAVIKFDGLLRMRAMTGRSLERLLVRLCDVLEMVWDLATAGTLQLQVPPSQSHQGTKQFSHKYSSMLLRIDQTIPRAEASDTVSSNLTAVSL